jgi:hypothetical protein
MSKPQYSWRLARSCVDTDTTSTLIDRVGCGGEKVFSTTVLEIRIALDA